MLTGSIGLYCNYCTHGQCVCSTQTTWQSITVDHTDRYAITDAIAGVAFAVDTMDFMMAGAESFSDDWVRTSHH